MNRSTMFTTAVLFLSSLVWPQSGARAVPVGFEKMTIAVNAPPAGLAFATEGSAFTKGTLFAFEAPPFLSSSSVIRVIQPDMTFGADIPIVSLDPDNFFIGGMTFDPISSDLLI